MLQASGLKTWDGARSANSSVAATCTHDRAFLRTGPGQFALRAFRQETMQVSMTLVTLVPSSAIGHHNMPCRRVSSKAPRPCVSPHRFWSDLTKES